MHAPRPTRTGVVVAAAMGGLLLAGAAFAGGVAVGRSDRPAPGVVAQAIAAVQAHGNATHSTADLDQAALRGLVGGLDDPWAAYYGIGGDGSSQSQLRALLEGPPDSGTGGVTTATAPAVTSSSLSGGIVAIRVPAFAAGSGVQVQAAVRAAEGRHATGVVLDLRGNPGGLLSEAVTAASAFLDGGPVVRLSGRTVPAQTLYASRGGDTTTPVAVLVDGGTASAAEIVAGALRDRDRAVLVGSRTFGKGSVQRVVPLSDGSSFELTVATYTTPDGDAVDGVGLTPDVVVPANAAPSVATARAVELLRALGGR